MTVVVDTSVLIDHLVGHGEARAAMQRAATSGERLVAAVLTKVEILAGMRPAEERATRALLGTLDWIAVQDDIAERAGAVANRFWTSHPGIDPVDYVIAATVQYVDAELWTRNVGHLPMFPGLQAPY